MGAAAGYANNRFGSPWASSLVSEWVFSLALVLLLFVMGFAFGADKEAAVKLKKAGLRILVVPLAVASGSLVGGLIGGLVLGLNVFGCMTVSAGFGWYTLVGPLVGDLLGAEWGMLGFVVNFLRELLTIVTVPFAVKVDKLVPVAFGGATAMDTTLPVITRYCGDETLITAFSSGFTLSLAAPFTITAMATLT